MYGCCYQMIWHGMACQAAYTWNTMYYICFGLHIRPDTSKHEFTHQKNKNIIENERRQQYEKWKKFIGVANCIKMHKNILINIDKKKLCIQHIFNLILFFVFYAKFDIILGIK